MSRGKARLGLVLAAFLVIQPVRLGAQCTTNITNFGTDTTASMMTMSVFFVTKTLGGTYMCTLAMANNVYDCNPGPTVGAMGTVSYLYASALTSATNPSCSWNCGCGAVAIDGGDGLPVELMGFAIED